MTGMTVRYDEVLGPLREAYDARAAWRDGLSKAPWKLAERQAFRERLAHGARLLEIGAGTGQDSAYFKLTHSSMSWTSTTSTPMAATGSSR